MAVRRGVAADALHQAQASQGRKGAVMFSDRWDGSSGIKSAHVDDYGNVTPDDPTDKLAMTEEFQQMARALVAAERLLWNGAAG